MPCSQAVLLLAVLHARLASGFCVWRPERILIPSSSILSRHYGQYGSDTPKVYSNFSEAADACLVGKTSRNCRQVLCTEEECTAPAGKQQPGMLYSPSSACYRPLPASGYCNRRSWYAGHPCKLNREDYCCEFDCEHCGPQSFCASTFGQDSGTCNPDYRGRAVCSKYYQPCDEEANPGRPTVPGVIPNTSKPHDARPPPAPLSVVQLGGGVKTKSCAEHGLSPVTSLAICELIVQALDVSSPVTQCDDAAECAKRPRGCIVQASTPTCESCKPTKAMVNPHGQHTWCGVGSNEYERFDCVCLGPGAEAVLRPAEGTPQPVGKRVREKQAADKRAANKELASARQKAHKAEAAAAASKLHEREGWKVAEEVKKTWMKESYMYKQMEAEVKRWRELAKSRQERREQNASNAAEVLSMRDELQWIEHKWLPALLGLTGVVLVSCAVCAFVTVCCFTFGYARVAREAREPKISEMQDAFAQADPISEFSQM